jgi:heptosyltransferase-3
VLINNLLKHFPSNIIISRTDSIGDMILALPVAKILKEQLPGVTIAMLAKAYTKPIALASEYVDAFIDVEDFFTKDVSVNGEKPQSIIFLNTVTKLARRAHELMIPVRIGTAGRLYHWKYCNYRVFFSRKNSNLHEAQLNLKLLKPFNINKEFSLSEIAASYGLTRLQPLAGEYKQLIKKDRFNVILHPKSQGNAREWSMDNFTKLAALLDTDEYNIFISGTETERKFIKPLLDKAGNKATDIIGRIPLGQFIPFINECDAVVANSTGPLHIAAALGKPALGLYPALKTKDAGRWGPAGKNAVVFQLKESCAKCIDTPNDCACINAITPVQIKLQLDEFCMLRKSGNITTQ